MGETLVSRRRVGKAYVLRVPIKGVIGREWVRRRTGNGGARGVFHWFVWWRFMGVTRVRTVALGFVFFSIRWGLKISSGNPILAASCPVSRLETCVRTATSP